MITLFPPSSSIVIVLLSQAIANIVPVTVNHPSSSAQTVGTTEKLMTVNTRARIILIECLTITLPASLMGVHFYRIYSLNVSVT